MLSTISKSGQVNEDTGLGTSDAELSWATYQEAAASRFDARQQQAARNEWRAAFEIAERFDANDPRRAASLNNMGIGLRIESGYRESERLYREAEQAWKNAALWVEDMRLQPRARSSLFHLRLEASHAQTYKRPLLARWQRLLSAGYAVTLNNLAELFERSGRLSQARLLYAQAFQTRAKATDAAEPLASRMRTNLYGMIGGTSPAQSPAAVTLAYATPLFSAQAEKMGWIVDRPPELTDEGRLMAAILCVHMLGRA